MNNDMRDLYLRGFVDGGAAAYMRTAQLWLTPVELTRKPESERVRAARNLYSSGSTSRPFATS
jgi:hypothetical protein